MLPGLGARRFGALAGLGLILGSLGERIADEAGRKRRSSGQPKERDMSLCKAYRVCPIVLALTCLVPASASAKRMDRGTAFRYAGTAPLPSNVGAPPEQLTVSGCKRQSSRAFVCSVVVAYKAPPQHGPTRVSGATLIEKVRVSYPTGKSKTPRVEVVPGTARIEG